jgi:hypothetical protein
MVVDPIDADHQARQRIAQIGRPQLQQLRSQRSSSLFRKLDLHHRQGEGDREHRVGERLHPRRTARRAFAGMVVPPRGVRMGFGVGTARHFPSTSRPALAFR